jgi:hypothetical protein
MKNGKKYLYVRPAHPPKWWPKVKGKPAFVGVMKEGVGWVVGQGDAMTEEQIETARVVMSYDMAGARFQVR